MKRKLSLVISAAAMSVLCLFAFSVYADTPPEVKIIDSTNTTATTYYAEYEYYGGALTPALTVKYNGERLEKNVDYTVTYSNNVNVGTAIAEIKGIGEYSGTFIKEYPIVPVGDATKINVSTASVVYDGNKKTPVPTVTFRKNTLKKDVDYTITYSKNIDVGYGSMTLTGKGNYSFVKNASFKIVPKAVTGLKFSPQTNSITLKWNKQDNISGYQIVEWNYDTKAYKSVKYVSADTTSYTIKGLSPSCLHKYNIRAYMKIGNETFYGVYTSDLLTRTRSASTNMTVAYMGRNGIVAKWNTVRGAGYVLRYATKSDFSNAKEIFINDSRTSSYTIKNVNKGANYYVQIAPYTTVNNTKYYSARSAALYTGLVKHYASYSTYYVNNANRTNNIKIASAAINGTVIMPGETFSFNQVVGRRTYEKGYKDAPVFVGGDKIENGVGGGICQVATTMFNTALYANVQITERSQHSMRVGYVPLGRDAAISWGSQDFCWKNTTNFPIKINITVANGKISCDFYTCKTSYKPKVELKVTSNGDKFTLKRYANGKCNYTTTSKY